MIYLLLPAYNEAPEIPPLFASVDELMSGLEEPLEIILVDDASTDNTSDLAQSTSCRAPVCVVRHPENQGLGGALLSGFKAITERHPAPEDVIITMDTDNTHHPSYIPEMVRKLRQDQLSLVVASRYAPGEKRLECLLYAGS